MIQEEAPKSKENIDFSELKDLCQKFIEFMGSDDYHEDNDFKYYIFESAVTSIYGKEVWDYINKRT